MNEPKELDWSEILPPPPFAARDQAHLEELLQEGMQSPTSPMTPVDWYDLHRDLRNRFVQRKAAKVRDA